MSLALLALSLPAAAQKTHPEGKKSKASAAAAAANPVLWRQPEDIADRNLMLGVGGAADAPQGTVMTFVSEDMDGTNPKYVVTDAAGNKFTVKLGTEAQPETAASRMTWAVGYFSREDYYLPEIRVLNLPAKLHRGANLIGPGGVIYNVRLDRNPPGDKKVGEWKWSRNPFLGTREFNGLRVLMSVIDNWDLKDDNNEIYEQTAHDGQPAADIYFVKDLGASFGMTHQYWNQYQSEGNAESYRESPFITKVTPDYVDLATPGLPRPLFMMFLWPTEIPERFHMRWIRERIPRADAAWMGGLLAQLTPRQIHDVFAGAGYSEADIAEFSAVLHTRILALQQLNDTRAGN